MVINSLKTTVEIHNDTPTFGAVSSFTHLSIAWKKKEHETEKKPHGIVLYTSFIRLNECESVTETLKWVKRWRKTEYPSVACSMPCDDSMWSFSLGHVVIVNKNVIRFVTKTNSSILPNPYGFSSLFFIFINHLLLLFWCDASFFFSIFFN